MSIVCSGDFYWLLVCSGVLVCNGISTNRVLIVLFFSHKGVINDSYKINNQ